MKILGILSLALSLNAFAEGQRDFLNHIECSATDFRTNVDDAQTDTSLIYADVVKIGDQIFLEEYGGHVRSGNYYGTFNGKNLIEVPFERATKYKEHFRFKDFDAVFTGGSESGMWGYLVVNKAVETAGSGDKVDAHYVFQAGDHMGGTVDYECNIR